VAGKGSEGLGFSWSPCRGGGGVVGGGWGLRSWGFG
jgi:hypothetical protein